MCAAGLEQDAGSREIYHNPARGSAAIQVFHGEDSVCRTREESESLFFKVLCDLRVEPNRKITKHTAPDACLRAGEAAGRGVTGRPQAANQLRSQRFQRRPITDDQR